MVQPLTRQISRISVIFLVTAIKRAEEIRALHGVHGKNQKENIKAYTWHLLVSISHAVVRRRLHSSTL